MWIANPLDVPKDVFMYTLHPARLDMLTEGPTDAEKALAGQHWAYSVELLERGTIIFGGRTLDKTGQSFAICVVRAESEEKARAIMEGDPAVKGGVFRAQLFRYQPMLFGEWPPKA
jgi:uncharacterized protein YciI